MKSKKAQAMQQMGQLAVGVAGLAIVLVITFLILAEGKTQAASVSGIVCNSTIGDSACNSTIILQDAVSDIPGWVPIIIITVIGAILIGLVGMFRRR